jgi:DNA-binding NarL/FixJ family response regulator
MSNDRSAQSNAVGRLTKREHEVLRLLAEGITDAEIAERLFVARCTASNHVSSILGKLQVRNRTAAVAWVNRSDRLQLT